MCAHHIKLIRKKKLFMCSYILFYSYNYISYFRNKYNFIFFQIRPVIFPFLQKISSSGALLPVLFYFERFLFLQKFFFRLSPNHEHSFGIQIAHNIYVNITRSPLDFSCGKKKLTPHI